MKTKYETCETCRFRSGTKCRKLKEFIRMDDFCSYHKPAKAPEYLVKREQEARI